MRSFVFPSLQALDLAWASPTAVSSASIMGPAFRQ